MKRDKKFSKSTPYAGTNRIRFLGYNLSPLTGAPPFIRPQK